MPLLGLLLLLLVGASSKLLPVLLWFLLLLLLKRVLLLLHLCTAWCTAAITAPASGAAAVTASAASQVQYGRPDGMHHLPCRLEKVFVFIKVEPQPHTRLVNLQRPNTVQEWCWQAGRFGQRQGVDAWQVCRCRGTRASSSLDANSSSVC